jgi:transposase
VDESGINQHMSREYGRALRGKRVVVKRPGRRFKRLNIVGGQIGTQVIAPCYYDWTTTALWFEVWFEWYFCPILPKNTYIIMDNARFHRKAELERIAKFYGFKIIWLPPYSPDKNPIEKLWANLKNWLRIFAHTYSTIQEAVKDYFK